MPRNESMLSFWKPTVYVGPQSGKSLSSLLLILFVATSTLVAAQTYPQGSQDEVAALKQQADVQKTNYQKSSASAWTAVAGQQSIDAFTAPIALYPDALIAQILICSTNPSQVETFAGWMTMKNDLQGSALQDAAQSAGFDGSFVAIASFPDVVKMMSGDMSWTTGLGQAFSSDPNVVFDSIQRLRAQAQAAGNLESTDQQEVQTETTSDGQQVIVIQPTNPQVVYLPTYDPQTVYAARAPAAAIRFTSGVIIGAAASNNYYYGPYAWHGAAMYNEAWNKRYDYVRQRNEMYQQNAGYRQNQYEQNAAQRQSAAQSNQAQRQSNADNMLGSAQANRAARQASAGGGLGDFQAQRGIQAGTFTGDSGIAASQRSGMNSGGFSGFQGGGQTRAESVRGNQSLSSSGRIGGVGGGGGRRR